MESVDSENESETTIVGPQKESLAEKPDTMSAGKSSAKSARTSGTKTGKKKRISKADMQAQYDARLNAMETNFNSKLDKMFDLITTMSTNQNKETSGLPRSVLTVENVSSGERRPPRQIVALEPNLDEDLGSPRISRNHDIDLRSEISFQVNQEERDNFDKNVSDFDSVSDNGRSPVRDNMSNVDTVTKPNANNNRFLKHVVSNDNACSNETENTNTNEGVSTVQKSEVKENRTNIISKVFKDEVKKHEASAGLVLDQAQVEILESSWRSSKPDRLTAFKEDYKACFPLHKSSEKFLEVPTLDDLLETMLAKTHGNKAVKGWDTHRTLHSQPYKYLEKLGYQGQASSRMNIISILYIQQALASLLKGLEEDEIDKEQACQTIRDVFAMSTKSLDLAGRNGAFMHMMRRKVAAEDSE